MAYQSVVVSLADPTKITLSLWTQVSSAAVAAALNDPVNQLLPILEFGQSTDPTQGGMFWNFYSGAGQLTAGPNFQGPPDDPAPPTAVDTCLQQISPRSNFDHYTGPKVLADNEINRANSRLRSTIIFIGATRAVAVVVGF